MADLDNRAGLTVEVVVHNHPLAEHDDAFTEDPPKMVTKYLEVSGNDTFEVLTKFHENFEATYGVRVEVRLDGVKVNSYLVRLKDLKEERGHVTSGVKSKIGNRWHKSSLVFSSFAVGE
jgi:hypothetical protein